MAAAFWFHSCQDAVSLSPPNVILMTAEPSIISIGETERIVLYAQSPLPEGIPGSVRSLYSDNLEAAGLTIVSWDFTDAFDISVTVEASQTAQLGTQLLDLPIENEYERFHIQFTVQVVR